MTSEKCDQDIYQNGHSIAMLDAPKEAAEAWVSMVREKSGQKVDWHYSCGRVDVLYVGNHKSVYSAIISMPQMDNVRVLAVYKQKSSEPPTKEVKTKAKLYPFLKKDEDLFKDVVFIVECTFNEQMNFWLDYYDKPRHERCKVKTWKEELRGQMVQIGELDNRPINICIWWAELDGYRVMFYDAVSQVVDYALIDEWILHFSKNIKWSNGTRWAHCDSSNFHLCLQALEELKEKSTV